MDSLSDGENESEIESIRLLATALQADKCDKNTVISSQYSVDSTSTVTASHVGDVTFTNRIETALAFNRIIEEKLRRLENVLLKRLEECKERLKKVHKITSVESKESFRYISCGRPYFKDQFYFPSPSNSDTVIMKQSNMFDFNNVSCLSGWTVKDKREFSNLILKVSQEAKTKELESQIAKLKREAQGNDVNVEKICKKLKKEIDTIHKKTIAEVAFPLEKEYDWDVFSNVLHNRHKPREFRAMWKLYLHPSINKAEWSREEQDKLLTLVEQYECKDWEAIAKELSTGRTGYQCFVFYRTNMNNTIIGQKWSREEEEYLKRLVALYRDGSYIPWTKIASKMGTRSKIQIYGKYLRLQGNKGRFHKEEDDVLLTCVNTFGTDFKKISNEYLVGRTHRQLRIRYKALNASKRVSALWTPEEDKRLIQFVSHNNSGAMNNNSGINFADLVDYFPGKNRSHLRSRYLILIRWMRLHPRVDLSKAPRRGVRRLGHGGVVEDLSIAVEKLKKKLTSECEKPPKQRISINSSELEIDDAITTTLINEKQKNETINREQAISINEGASYLEPRILNSQHLSNLLILLRAKLNKNVFERSRIWANKYPNLISENVSLAKPATFVSYSRKKEPVKEVKMLGSTDIWGNALLSHTEYVLPPHFATITGLRKLMQYVVDLKPGRESHIISRKNVDAKAQYDLLLNRFQQLFLWPMILSNNNPSKIQHENSRACSSSEFILSTMPAVEPEKEVVEPKVQLPVKRTLSSSYITIPRVKKQKRKKKGLSEDPNYKMDEDYQILIEDNQRKPIISLTELDGFF